MSDSSGRWQGTDETFHVTGSVDRVPEFAGEHLWVVLTMYRWGGPRVETPTLDGENLLSLVGPGCFYCELEYNQRVAATRCRG